MADDDVAALVEQVMARYPKDASPAKKAKWVAAFFYGLLQATRQTGSQPLVDAVWAAVEDMPDEVWRAFDEIRARIQ